MSVFLVLVGVLAWIVAFLSFVASKSAIQEIFAAVSFLIGVLSFIGAAICSKIDAARDEATSERGQMQDELKAMRAALERLSPAVAEEPPARGARYVTS